MFWREETQMSEATTSTVVYTVAGLTCAECIVKVMDHVRWLPGVDGVAVDLVRGGQSVVTIRSGPGGSVDAVEVAVGEAGFDVIGHWPGVHDLQQDSMIRCGPQSAEFDLSKGGRR